MAEPTLTVIGVYRPAISAETWQQQWQVTDNDDATRKHFDELVLIEVMVEGLSGPLDLGQFGQMNADHPGDFQWMQVVYDEGLLSADGEMLIERAMDCVRGTGPLRFAAYLHMYDPERPLQWQGGTVICPPMEDVPARLIRIMPYNACS
ncbi:MAG: hypothetical protein ABI995_11625 [Acidobacteriota bacterium]